VDQEAVVALVYKLGNYNGYSNREQTYRRLRRQIILERTSKGKLGNLCTHLISTTIKQKISTLSVRSSLGTMLPEHILVSHLGYCFIVDVQPNFPCVAVTVRAKYVDRIVPAACIFAVMVEDSIELVVRWLRV